jgi:hypothetical protein
MRITSGYQYLNRRLPLYTTGIRRRISINKASTVGTNLTPTSLHNNNKFEFYPGNEEGHQSPYHQQYHPHGEGPVSVVYRHHPVERQNSMEDQPHRHSQHAYNPAPQQQQQREYHQDPRPSMAQQISGPEIYAAADVPHTLSEADDRLMRYHFPLDTQGHLRRALFHVLNAPWKRANDREPTDEALLQFTTRNGKLYQCSFAKAEGRCVKEFDRKDRVLDHIRTHIDLQPFVCRDIGWYVPFIEKESFKLVSDGFLSPASNDFAPSLICCSTRKTKKRRNAISGMSSSCTACSR